MPKPIKGIMHCFSGTKVDVKDYLDMGLYISLAGALTFPNAHNLREVTKTIPLDRLLIETDSPYLAPQTHRGKRNEPAYVIYVAQTLADILGTSLEKVAEQTTQNTLNLFGKIL
jgi:TatD DNase family protein